MESSLRTDVAGRVEDELPSLRTEVAGLVEEDEPLPEVPLVEDDLSDDTCFAAPPFTGVTRRCPEETVVPVVLSEDGGVRLADDAAELRSSCLPVLRDVLDCEDDDVEV